MNEDLSLLFRRFVPTEVIRMHIKDKPWFNHDWRYAFEFKWRLIVGGLRRWSRETSSVELTGMSLSAGRLRLMRSMIRRGISFCAKTWMFWWTLSDSTSGGPLEVTCVWLVFIFSSSHWCESTVDWSARRLVKQICCQISLTVSNPGIQCIYHPFAIRLPVLLWHMPHGISSHHLYFPTFVNNKFFFQFY